MSDKSQHRPKSPQPETSTSTETQHDVPDYVEQLLTDAIAHLNESERKESELLENNRELEEENKRMQENDKLFSKSLQSLLGCLKIVKPGDATVNEDDPKEIIQAVCRYLIESKNPQSCLSKKLVLLEEEKKKIYEDLDILKADLEQANCKANKRLLDLKNSDNRLKATKVSLAGHRDRALQRDKVIDEMKEVISHVDFPPGIVSRDVTQKIRWLVDEHEKTCEDLGSMKVDLEQARRELDKFLPEDKKIIEDLDTIKFNLGQPILEASSSLDEIKKSSLELQKSNINLKAADDRDLAQDNVICGTNKAILGIKFPPEIVSRDIAHKIRWLADMLKKTCEDLDSTKLDLEQAHKELDKCMLEKKKISEDLDTTKENLKQSILEASSAKDETKKFSWELQKCDSKLKAAERSLANHQDRSKEQGKVIDETKEVLSHINFPQRIVSGDIAHKVRWLADEHKKTCEELGSTKADLEQASFRADTAERELETTKLNLKQANLEASRKLSTMEVNFKQAKKEIDECRTELSGCLDKIEHVISHTEFPTDTQPKDTLTKTEWLSGHYNKNFINSMISIIESNPEAAIGLLHRMEAKIAVDLSETLRLLAQEADVEVTRAEDLDSVSSDASHTEFAQRVDDSKQQNTGGAVTTDQDTTYDAEQGSCSGGSTIVEDSVYSPTSGRD